MPAHRRPSPLLVLVRSGRPGRAALVSLALTVTLFAAFVAALALFSALVPLP